MSSTDIDRLIILHLADLEDAMRRIGDLQAKIATVMDDIMRECADAAGWSGTFDWNRTGIKSFPKDWIVNEEKNDQDAFFELSTLNNFDEDEYWLTSLCRSVKSEYGFRFNQNIVAPKRKWHAFIRSYSEEITKSGFILDEIPSLFLPVHVDGTKLAEAVADGDIKSALEPLREAYNRLIVARPLFDALMEKAKALH